MGPRRTRWRRHPWATRTCTYCLARHSRAELETLEYFPMSSTRSSLIASTLIMSTADFEYPCYVLDLRQSLNCATIESASRSKPFRVLVRPEDDENAAPIPATGTLSDNGEEFLVVVSTDAGTQTCWRRPNFEPLCRPNIEPGWEPTLRWSAVDKFRSLAGSATSV